MSGWLKPLVQKVTIDSEINVLSLAGFALTLVTFVVSITALVISLWGWLHGAPIRLLAPEQVTFYPHGSRDPAKAATEMGISMAYVNDSTAGQAGIIDHESVSYSFAKLDAARVAAALPTYTEHWENFGEFNIEKVDASGNIVTPPGRQIVGQPESQNPADLKQELQFQHKADALPFSVPAGGAVVHTTQFAPRPAYDSHFQPKWDFQRWQEFLADLDRNDVISITVTASIYGRKDKLVVAVEVPITKNTRDMMRQYSGGSPAVALSH